MRAIQTKLRRDPRGIRKRKMLRRLTLDLSGGPSRPESSHAKAYTGWLAAQCFELDGTHEML
jgi:hypothetical protein